jgi:hypothetical protein
LPGARFKFVADAEVTIETISVPPGSSIITSVFTAPGTTFLTFP